MQTLACTPTLDTLAQRGPAGTAELSSST